MVSLLNPPTYEEVKGGLVQLLYDSGIIGVLNWQTGSVPNALLETEAHTVYQWLQDQTVVVAQGLNSIATGEPLKSLSYEVYQNDRGTGKITIGDHPNFAATTQPREFRTEILQQPAPNTDIVAACPQCYVDRLLRHVGAICGHESSVRNSGTG